MESDNAGSHDGNLWMRQQIDPNDDQNKQFYRAPYQVRIIFYVHFPKIQ